MAYRGTTKQQYKQQNRCLRLIAKIICTPHMIVESKQVYPKSKNRAVFEINLVNPKYI